MKLQTLVAGLYWASSALATVNKTVNADGQIESVVYSNGALAKRDCTSNNCVRAYKARPLAATSFCQTFTAAAATAVAPFTQCTDLKQASSACSCYVPKATTTTTTSTSTSSTTTPEAPSCSPPGGHCTPDTFVEDCCPNPDGSAGCEFPTGDAQDALCFLP